MILSHQIAASHSMNVTAEEFARLIKEKSQGKIGMFMDTTSAANIMVPIFYPIDEAVGIDGIHFGMVMVLTFILGGITSPVSGTLFIATTVAIIKFVNLLQEMWPSILLFLLVLFSVAYFPAICLRIPSLVG